MNYSCFLADVDVADVDVADVGKGSGLTNMPPPRCYDCLCDTPQHNSSRSPITGEIFHTGQHQRYDQISESTLLLRKALECPHHVRTVY